MNVLHIIEGIDAQLGGLPVAMLNLIKIEKRLNYKSHILSISKINDNYSNFSENYHLFPPSFPARFSRSSEAISWLKKNCENYDLIVIHGIWNALCIEGAQVASNHNVKYIVWPHGSLDPFDLQKKEKLKKLIGPLLIDSVLKKANKVCFTSRQEAVLVETYGSTINKAILPLPVDNELNYEADKASFRSKYGFKVDDFIILFLGRINYKKNIETIIAACSLLKPEFPELRLAIAGPDKNNGFADSLKSLVARSRLENTVTFCGELSGQAKADAFHSSDCFVLPSFNENFGIAVVESLQHSLPVIISKNVYIWEDIIEKGGGWACGTDKESLYVAIRNLLVDQNEYNRKKESSKSAADFFSVENLLPTYRNLYNNFENNKLKG